MRRQLLAWTVDLDPEATRAAYRRMEGGAAIRCGCAACRNFDAARPENFPDSFRLLLSGLDVELRKEASVRLISTLEAGRRLYTGSYGFCGVILAGRPFRGFPLAREEVDVFERVGLDAHLALRPWHEPPAPWGGEPCVKLEFLVALPWVLAGTESPGGDRGCPLL